MKFGGRGLGGKAVITFLAASMHLSINVHANNGAVLQTNVFERTYDEIWGMWSGGKPVVAFLVFHTIVCKTAPLSAGKFIRDKCMPRGSMV